MQNLPEELRGAIVGFVVLLCKGLLDDPRWDWDLDKCDWKGYQCGFTDPTILRTTMAVFVNRLQLDDRGNVVNYDNAKFRAFQYFRSLIDDSFPSAAIDPPMRLSEMEEPDWLRW